MRTVRLVCEEKAIAYDLDPLRPGATKDQGLHPFGKIPVMTEGDFTLFETLAIACYLDATHDGPALQPADPRDRARMIQRIGTINDVVYDAMVRRFSIQYAFPRAAGGQSDREVIDGALPRIRHQLAVLDRAIGDGSFLAGDRLSLADLFLGPILFYLRLIREGAGLMQSVPSLERAYGTIAARPSFAATEPELPPAFAT